MIYAATSVWLIVVVLLAWGVHHIWTGIAKPKTVNAILLPGTLVARLGHTVGLLITGATINKAGGTEDDDEGGPDADAHPRPKIPVIGPIVVALLPMLALAAAVYLVIVNLGMPVVAKMPQGEISTELPASLAAFWDQLRALITLAEGTLNAVWTAEGIHWRIAVFVYLMISLTVRMAPLPGNVRGHLGAIVTVGVVAWLVGTVSSSLPETITSHAWPLLSLAVGWLLVLMLITLIVRGAVSATQMMLRWER